MLYVVVFATSLAFSVRECIGLVCYSCNSLFGPCDGNSCRAVPGGFCAYQQTVNANGYIVNTRRSCLATNLIAAGPSYLSQIGQCIETLDSNTGLTYRTYLCNNQNYCNAVCQLGLSATTSIPTTRRVQVLECFKCENFATDCFTDTCTIANGGYCLFQLLNVSISGVSSVHYSKQCIGTPIAKTPDGNIVTQVNRCIVSTDILGNRFYTLICNETNMCNANCYRDPIPLPAIPVIPDASTSLLHPSAAKLHYLLLLVSAFAYKLYVR